MDATDNSTAAPSAFTATIAVDETSPKGFDRFWLTLLEYAKRNSIHEALRPGSIGVTKSNFGAYIFTVDFDREHDRDAFLATWG